MSGRASMTMGERLGGGWSCVAVKQRGSRILAVLRFLIDDCGTATASFKLQSYTVDDGSN